MMKPFSVAYEYAHTHTLHLFIYLYMWVCVFKLARVPALLDGVHFLLNILI